MREINEELIYRECRNPPQQSREEQGRTAAPLESGRHREQQQPPPLWQTQNGVSTGAAPQGQLRNWTGVSHTVWDIRQRLCMTRNMEETGRLWGLVPFNHSFTGDSSQSTPSLPCITPRPCLYLEPSQRNTQLWLNWAPSNADMLLTHFSKTVQVSLGREMARIVSHTLKGLYVLSEVPSVLLSLKGSALNRKEV